MNCRICGKPLTEFPVPERKNAVSHIDCVQRVYRVYRFTDLPVETQERILAQDAENPPCDLFNELIQDDISCDINCNDFLQSEILPAYMTLHTRSRPNSTSRSKPENDVRYTSDGYRYDVEFDADVDMCQFLRAHKLGSKYRTLYNAAKDGCIDGSILERNSNGWRDINRSYATVEGAWDWHDEDRTVHLEAQAVAAEELLQTEYEIICGKIESHFQTIAEYYGSDAWYRDERTEGVLSEILYFFDGTEVPEDIVR